METTKKGVHWLIAMCILCLSMSGLLSSGVASASTSVLTLKDVKASVLAGRSLTAPERHLLATTAAQVTGDDPALLEQIITLQPAAVTVLPVLEKTVASPVSTSTTAIPASCASGNASRTGTRYAYNITGATIYRYRLTKNWAWSTCYGVANDSDFMSSDDIEGYVYGPFQWAWSYDGTTSHSGGYYNFNGFPYGGHTSLIRGKFSYCISVPIIGDICPQRQYPWVKVNGHYTSSSAVYTG